MSSSVDPASSSPSNPPNTVLAKLFSSKTPTNSFIARINRLLSTTGGVDSTLCVTTYTLYLVSAQCTRALQLDLKAVLARIVSTSIQNAAKANLGPGETMLATATLPKHTSALADIAAGSKALAGVASEMRTCLRLWGLLGVWAAAGRLYETGGPKDWVLKALAWGQVGTISSYFFFENAAFLAGKGVLPRWTAEDRGRWMMGALQVFTLHIALDFVKLARLWQLTEPEYKFTADRMGEKGELSTSSPQVAAKEMEEKRAAREAENQKWWKTLYYDGVFVPLCLHWMGISGCQLNDETVGVLGLIYGFTGFSEAWRKAA